MHSIRFGKFPRGRFTWLLWLALLLPLAQIASAVHLLSHVPSKESSQRDDPHAIHADHCDLDLSALAVTGGAPLISPIAFLPALVPTSAPHLSESLSWFARPARPYESRAPPLAPY